MDGWKYGFISKNNLNKFSDSNKFSTKQLILMIADLNYLKTMSGGDDNFIAEMIELFREQVAEYREHMPRLLKEESFDSLSKLAHKAKSSVAVMGMTEVADLLKELEILASKGDEKEKYEGMINIFLSQSELALKELDNQH